MLAGALIGAALVLHVAVAAAVGLAAALQLAAGLTGILRSAEAAPPAPAA
jgi:hypothetical protein